MQKPQFQKPAFKKEVVEDANFRGIIRILGKDIDGHLKMNMALTHIRGIGFNAAQVFVNAIEAKLKIPRTTRAGDLTEEQIVQVEEILRNSQTAGLPAFAMNRQRDLESGTNKHAFASDLQFITKQDIQFQKDIKNWIGWRHTMGQKVRGQRNRTTGRSGLTVGVLKKALKSQQKPAEGESSEKTTNEK